MIKKENKIQTLRNTIKSLKYIIKQIWKENDGKKYIIIKMLASILNSVLPLVYTIVPGLIINILTNGVWNNDLIFCVAVITITPVILSVFNTLIDSHLYKIKLKLRLLFIGQFYLYTATMDYETVENPDIQIQKGRVQQTLENSIDIIDRQITLFSAIIRLIMISYVILTLNPFIILLIAILIYFNSFLTKKINKKMYIIGQELSRHDRQQWGISYMLEQPMYAKEIRLFRLSKLMTDIYKKRKTEANLLEVKQFKISRKLGIFNSILNFIQQLVVYIYLIYSVLKRNLEVGSMTIYIGMVAQFTTALSSVFDIYLSLANENFNIQEMKDFFDIPKRHFNSGKKKPKFDSNSTIEFRNVSFKYPGSDNYALKNLNLTIRGNEKLCIVGVNGSGKSTFIKLLTRLYWLEEGEILLNGVNINEYDYESYQRLFAPVFQDFVRYYFTLGENIVLTNEFNLEKLDDICEKCGLKKLVNRLPKGYNTQVDKFIDEEGFEPSGGEDQRIAIARAYYNGGKIYLLDEPTAAIDPIAEYEIYKQFNNMMNEKCAVLITHRLSAVQLVDKIAVFDNGHVSEYGTHIELYSRNGIYTEMFDKQAQFYCSK